MWGWVRSGRPIARALGLAASLLVAGPALGGDNVLYRGNGAEPETLDIHHSTGIPEFDIEVDLFEGLVQYGPAGEPVPGVADRWTVSDDGLTYRFHLRADARWSNGDPVTADDFVFALRRAVSPATASRYAFILFPIANAEAIASGAIADPRQLGVAAPDARTVVFTLGAPTPYFLGLLTHHMAFPVHRATLERYGERWTRPGNLVGNGAYRLVSWVPQSEITLVKNPNYWDAASVKIDRVVYVATEDVGAELRRYRADELDVTNDVPVDQIAWIAGRFKQEFRRAAYLGTYYYGLNLRIPPFKDAPKLRQALALAIDRDTLVERITRAGEQPAYSWVPPGIGNRYVQQLPDWAHLPQAERDRLAQRLYREAGYGSDHPARFELLYNTSENHKRIAIAIAGMWKETLGADVILRNEEWKVYLASRAAKQFEMLRQAWIGDYNDANTFLELLKSDIGDQNSEGYANPQYDALMQRAERTIDLDARARLMEAAERIMLADMPLIPIYHYVSKRLVKPWVAGWVDNIVDVHPTRYLGLLPH
ncbi:MAG TPA: peptide ABC transporter substrate-binding protein [Candidatus Sulfotelmatobacter sp.]|nr:peptide ABC transporter substrate-binding protein [Candidatus Sulfotelmatobacter sp.]